jgi:hypothetical protein
MVVDVELEVVLGAGVGASDSAARSDFKTINVCMVSAMETLSCAFGRVNRWLRY